MAIRYQAFPVIGPGSLEVVDGKVRIKGRRLGMQWLASLLGMLGFIVGGLVLLSVPSLPRKLYIWIWLGPAVGGAIAGHFIGKYFSMKRGPTTREIPLAKVRDVSTNRDVVEIVVKTGWVNKAMITFTATVTGEVLPLARALRNQSP